MKKLIAITLIVVAAVVAACSSGYNSTESQSTAIADALYAIKVGDNASARNICDDILKSTAIENLSASTLGQMSLIYMRLSDSDEMEDNTALAFQCYRNAYKVNADSAAAFYNGVEGEMAQYVNLLSMLRQQLENPSKNNFEDHEAAPVDTLGH